MLYWSVAFYVIALVAGFLGYSDPHAPAAVIARLLFFLFLGGFLAALVKGLTRPRR